MHPRIDKFKFYDLVIYAARGSTSARRLASALACRRWRDDLPERYSRRRPYFRGNSSPMVVNWGSTRPANWLADPRFRLTPIWINGAEAVQRAVNKAEFFKALEGAEVPILRNTSNRNVVEKWLEKGFGVVARKTLTGSEGAGIKVMKPGDAVVDAPLYTRYYPKTHEFRLHMWGGKVIDITQKKLRNEDGNTSSADRTIRSHNRGWIHAHDDLVISQPEIETMGAKCSICLSKLGLHFGAIDLLAVMDDLVPGSQQRRLKSFVICEVNTGPGLENTKTIQAYADTILREKNGIRKD